MKCFTLHVMNLKYMKVSLFEISYKKKISFSPYCNFLRCTCIIYYVNQALYFRPQKKKKNPGLLHMKNHPLHMSKLKLLYFEKKLAIYNG